MTTYTASFTVYGDRFRVRLAPAHFGERFFLDNVIIGNSLTVEGSIIATNTVSGIRIYKGGKNDNGCTLANASADVSFTGGNNPRINAFRAYFELSDDASASEFVLNFDGV